MTTQRQQQWYDAIPDEAFEDETEDAPVVVTSQSLRCGGISHPTHVVLFSVPAYVAWNAMLAEAQRQGWEYRDATRRRLDGVRVVEGAWLCPLCVKHDNERKRVK